MMKDYGRAAVVLGISMVLASLVFGLFFFCLPQAPANHQRGGVASKQYESDTVNGS